MSEYNKNIYSKQQTFIFLNRIKLIKTINLTNVIIFVYIFSYLPFSAALYP